MNFSIILAALLVALISTIFLSVFINRSFRGLWLFFLLLFLAVLSGQLWIRPFGPVAWGIAWVPLIITTFFFVFLILALLPASAIRRNAKEKTEEDAFMVLGTFLWIILIMLLISIAIGYYRMPELLAK